MGSGEADTIGGTSGRPPRQYRDSSTQLGQDSFFGLFGPTEKTIQKRLETVLPNTRHSAHEPDVLFEITKICGRFAHHISANCISSLSPDSTSRSRNTQIDRRLWQSFPKRLEEPLCSGLQYPSRGTPQKRLLDPYLAFVCVTTSKSLVSLRGALLSER